MDTYKFSIEELQNEYDQVKNVLLENMVEEKLITLEQAKDYSMMHTVIIKKPSKISKFLKEYFSNTGDWEAKHILVTKINWLREEY